MPQSVPWFQDPSIRLALGTTVAPSLYQLLVMLGVKMPLSQEKFTPIFVTTLLLGGGIVWIVRRIKRGNDPLDPAAKVTLVNKND